MVGFLGTVTGMVRAFMDMANAGTNVDVNVLSTGIYEALVTTVGGLIVGIIALFVIQLPDNAHQRNCEQARNADYGIYGYSQRTGSIKQIYRFADSTIQSSINKSPDHQIFTYSHHQIVDPLHYQIRVAWH